MNNKIKLITVVGPTASGKTRLGVELAKTVDHERVYAENKTTRKSTLHMVGDPKNFITTGVQRVYGTRLTGYNKVFGVYSLKKYGKGDDIKLTLDSEICKLNAVGVVNSSRTYKSSVIVEMFIVAFKRPLICVNDKGIEQKARAA